MSGSQQIIAATKIAGGGGGYTLIYDGFAGGGGAWPINDNIGGAHTYAGQLNFNDATPRTIGKINFRLSLGGGTIVGKTYVAKIWSVTGNDLNAVLATSTGVTGVDAWSQNTVPFIFSSPFTTTGSVNYGITIDCGTTPDTTNFAQAYNNNATPIPGTLSWWENTQALNSTFAGFNIQIQIYTTP